MISTASDNIFLQDSINCYSELQKTFEKEPEGDVKKEYCIACFSSDDWEHIHQVLMEDGSLEDNIPNDSCECANDRLHSPTRGVYLLTDSEAEILRNHSSVKYVHVNYEKYSGTYGSSRSQGIFSFVEKKDRYTSTVKHQRQMFDDATSGPVSGSMITNTPTSADLNRAGRHLYRHKQKADPWYGLTNTTIFNDNHQQYGTGKDIDLVVCDLDCWIGHIEFQNNILNANPKNYIGGNVLPGNGTCDVLDLVLDAPYYIDPDFFNADSATRLMTRWDGTVVPTETAARNWWGNNSTSYRSSKFVSVSQGGTAVGNNDFGTISIASIYTRLDNLGDNQNKPNGSYDHGTGCASLAYGRSFGWAYNANKWFIANGDYGVGYETYFDLLKVFAKIKPINSNYGTKDPTISSNSWGFNTSIYGDLGLTNYLWFRPSAIDGSVSGTSFAFTNFPGNIMDAPEHNFPTIVDGHATKTASDECLEDLDANIIFVAASGNSSARMQDSDHVDFNNYYYTSDNTALADAKFTLPSSHYIFPNGEYIRTIDRRGWPASAGVNINTTPYTYPVIHIGCLDHISQGDGKERLVDYSNRGTSIDCYTSGHGSLAATSKDHTDGVNFVRRWDAFYDSSGNYSNSSINGGSIESSDRNIGGTSSACPIAAGIIATKVEYNRSWTYANVRNWIRTLDQADSNQFYYGGGTPSGISGSDWQDLYNLHGSSGYILYDALSGNEPETYSGIRLRGNINFNSNRVPEYEITNLPSNVDEGQSISPIIGATPAWKNLITNDSYRVYWQLSGVGIASTDFENVSADGNPDTGTTLTGYVDTNVPSGAKQFSIGIRSDTHTDDPDGAIVDASENATLSIYRDSARTTLLDSKTFAINDTSLSEPEYEVLLVAGGATGGNTSGAATYISWGAAGGGGAGGVRHLSLQSLFGNGAGQYTNVYFEIGYGGINSLGQANGGPTKMYDGTSNGGTLLYQVEGGGVGAFNGGRVVNTNGDDVSAIDGGDAPANGGSGGGGNSHCDSGNTLGGSAGLYGNDGGGVSDRGGGGNGGGAGGAAPTRTAATSRGGYGYDLTNFFSELSTDGPNGDGRIAGGGGGGHTVSQNGVYEYGSGPAGTGQAGGGDGGNSSDGDNAAANSGSGGGGAGGVKGSQGGNGGSGIVYVKYSSTVQLLEWTGTASDHIVTSYNVNTGNGINPVWIHKILGDGYLSVI